METGWWCVITLPEMLIYPHFSHSDLRRVKEPCLLYSQHFTCWLPSTMPADLWLSSGLMYIWNVQLKCLRTATEHGYQIIIQKHEETFHFYACWGGLDTMPQWCHVRPFQHDHLSWQWHIGFFLTLWWYVKYTKLFALYKEMLSFWHFPCRFFSRMMKIFKTGMILRLRVLLC